jgi:hypothetical protein
VCVSNCIHFHRSLDAWELRVELSFDALSFGVPILAIKVLLLPDDDLIIPRPEKNCEEHSLEPGSFDLGYLANMIYCPSGFYTSWRRLSCRCGGNVRNMLATNSLGAPSTIIPFVICAKIC